MDHGLENYGVDVGQGGGPVSAGMESLYRQYLDFVTRLHAHLDVAAGGPISPGYRAPKLPYDDFCHMWEDWGRSPGVQEVWRHRFEAGYLQAATELRDSLQAALIGRSRVAGQSSRAA